MILGASPIEGELIVRAIVATALGSAVGLERSFRHKDAGLRTLALVALGSCAFATAGYAVLSLPALGQTRPDPTRIAAQVVSGVGFLGAGAIFVSGGQRIRGLTTAADIWLAAASGVLCGVGLLLTAAAVTALGLAVVVCFAPAANWFRKREAKARGLTARDDDSDLS
jgi:putative Mg2+ transporter-C (MgtC) family protein